MQQIFVQHEVKLNESFYLNNEQTHHFLVVMRLNKPQTLRVVDSMQRRFYAQIEPQGKQVSVTCTQEILHSCEREHHVTLLMGLIKKDKWDFLIQKCTELGVHRIVPFESKRTVVKSKDERIDKQLQRWNKIATEAAQQCKRDVVPEVCKPISFKEITNYSSSYNFIAYEDAQQSGVFLRDVVRAEGDITIVVGPEGGFEAQEVAQLMQNGFECVTLGKRILRAETAAIYMLSAIDALIE